MIRKNKARLNIILFVSVLCICLIAALFVCTRKAGFHEDEYYTYYSSNRTDGFWVEDGQTIERQTILNEFSVLPGEGFNFGLVKEVQSWDVHPPLYYFFIHGICSLSPGRFNMWQGLILNLICYVVALGLVIALGQKLIPDSMIAPYAVALIWGISASTLTAVVFIRMYMLLTVWVLAITLLHVKWVQNISDTDGGMPELKKYIMLGGLTFLGFMTHYYFFIWLFFLAAVFNLYALIRTKKIKRTVYYAITMVVTFALCLAFYPSWPAQMFRGQRGSQATGNFLDVSNTWERLVFFADKVNRIGFGGLLWIILICIIALLVWQLIRDRKEVGLSGEESAYTDSNDSRGLFSVAAIMILAAALLYFLVVSKTALMLGDSSIRYQMPILGVVSVSLASVFISLCYNCGIKKNTAKLLVAIAGFILLAGNIMSDGRGSISFLYPEESMHEELIADNSDARPLYIYNSDPSQIWCVWDSTEEFLKFNDVLFVAGDTDDALAPDLCSDIEGANTLIIYVDKSVDTNNVINRLGEAIPDLSTIEPDYSHEFCDVYIVRR